MEEYLFVYGSLLDADNFYGEYVRNHCTCYGAGKFKGRLYDIGDYPGAVAGDSCSSLVSGNIYKLAEPSTVLAVLDEYEGFGERQPQPNEFIRRQVILNCDYGSLHCWIYLYNLPVTGLKYIATGDYLGYLQGE